MKMEHVKKFENFLNEATISNEELNDIVNRIRVKLPDLEKAINKQSNGLQCKLQVELETNRRGSRIRIFDDTTDFIKAMGPMGNVLFSEFQIDWWAGNTDDKSVFFIPKVGYRHPGGGSNGVGMLWNNVWFMLDTDKWEFGRIMS